MKESYADGSSIPKCVLCGSWKGLQTHHLKPLSKGGLDVPENIVFLCPDCHKRMDHGYAHRKEGNFDVNTSFGASFYIGTAYRPTWQTFRQICIGEGTTASQKLVEYITDYVTLHEPGNPQQHLDTILKIGKAYHSPSKICGFKDCMRDAVGVAFYVPRNEEYGYCSIHAKDIKDHADLWKVLK